ncbi:MAG: Cell wall-associated hydrolase, invasion-associated protein [Thermoleophilia bacterium]|nr:Cell wall-associated hydrolase, invasion-associated protein [Thermoleophilia bacterium]
MQGEPRRDRGAARYHGPHMRPYLLAAVVLVSAAFATFAAAPSASPAASLASRQAQAAELDAQVAKIEGRYDELQERFRGAEFELERIQTEVEEAHRVVVATRRDLGIAKVTLSERADSIYRSGGGEDLAELVSAGSLTNFFDRIETRRRIGDQDANVLEKVEILNARVEAKERTLTSARTQAAAATRRAKAAKVAMGKVLAERQAKLDSVNADIRAIMEEQRRIAAAKAAAAARETAALARTDEAPGSATGGGSSSSGSSSMITVPLPPGSGTAASAASIAMGKIGSPYVWGAAGPDTFDCSGLVVWAFAQAGRSGLPHSTYSLINMGVEVPLDQLQVGDLLFSSSLGHMAIYVGNNSFVHAPHSGDVVKVTSMSDYQLSRARRL